MGKIFSTLFLFVNILALNISAQSVSTQGKNKVNIANWVNTHFAKGKTPPFSFTYNGVPSRNFITKWKYAKTPLASDEQGGEKIRYTFTDPKTRLEVACDVTYFTDFDAVEWIVRFTNKGSANTPEIAHVKDADIRFAFPQKGLSMIYENGSTSSRADFAVQRKDFLVGDTLRFRPRGGRSSGQILPFFDIESPDSRQGIITSIGWTGEWCASFIATSPNTLSMKTGIEALESYLEPGESIRTSSVVFCFWNSDNRFDGTNKFRRLIMTHHSRKIDGKTAIYPYLFGFSWGDPKPCNEYSCLTAKMALALLERQQMFGLKAEASWLDAGWYVGADDFTNNKSWINTVGNWETNHEHFPNGLKEVSDAVHKMGRQFLLWFEPERVYEGSMWHKQHPQWLLKKEGSRNFLMNLGNDKACDYVCKFIGDFIEENGVDIYRQDFNILPEPFWLQADKPGRKGMTEVKYITGLYKFWDYLLTRFPHLLIDNCASGGHRLDWETTLRSIPLWRTDDCYYNDPSDMQCHGYGINLFLPQTGTGMGNPDKSDKYSLRSSLASTIVFNWKIMTYRENFLRMQECQKEFEAVRAYFLEDYYPLTGLQNTDARDNWLAYECYRPADKSGIVVAFRHHDNKQDSITVQLQGLQDNISYEMKNADTNQTQVCTGKQLKTGFGLKLDKPDQSLPYYFKAQ